MPLVLKTPYLLFLGAAPSLGDAKTAMGIAHWRRELCCGQLRLPGCNADTGLPDLDLETAQKRGAKSLIIGVAPMGGRFDPAWIDVFHRAARLGYDIVSGMHTRLASVPRLSELAAEFGGKLLDVRVPPADIPVATGAKRPGRRLLTVGTDCAVGKKYTALALEKELRSRGVKADFRATGQTGIFISGRGVAIDSVIADFISGAAEWLSPENTSDHWDVIEGQGSLFHPSYAGVTLGLIHGSQPDAMVICHDARRSTLTGYDDFPIADFRPCADAYISAARLTNTRTRVVGISLNTSHLPDNREARKLLAATAKETSLPCCDPIRFGVGEIVDNLLRQ